MTNRSFTVQQFAQSFEHGLHQKYGIIPSSSFIAMEFNLRAHGVSTISRESARKWMGGLALPSPDNLPIIIKWLDLDPHHIFTQPKLGGSFRSPKTISPKSQSSHEDILAQKILDSLNLQIAVIDRAGKIVQVNTAWRKFGESNAKVVDAQFFLNHNYLQVCEKAIGSESRTAHKMAAGIRGVLNGARSEFAVKYPCHAPHKKRWFVARVSPLENNHQTYAVVSHESISEKNYSLLDLE